MADVRFSIDSFKGPRLKRHHLWYKSIRAKSGFSYNIFNLHAKHLTEFAVLSRESPQCGFGIFSKYFLTLGPEEEYLMCRSVFRLK